MKTYNQFLHTPFSEEIAPPEPQEEDPGIKSKEKRQSQIKKMVLMKKLQAVRAGSGADIVASHTPEGDVLDERLGGKGYKARSDSRGVKVSGDWEDSDRGAGNKAKKRSGGKVEKKSPTYKAHVLNKEEVVEDKAFNFVLDKIRKEVGKDGYVSKDNPRKPQSAAEKAKVRAHQAKVDKENAAERKKDPSQGRYPKG